MTQFAEADTFVRGGSFADDNYGSQRSILSKSQGGDKYRRYGLVRFDLSSFNAKLSTVSLDLIQSRDGVQQVEVFGLLDGRDGWDEMSVTYNSASSDGLLNQANAVSLGFIDFTADGAGSVQSLAGSALSSFLSNQVGGDGLATFLFVSTETRAHNVALFSSREGLGGGASLNADAAVPVPAAALLFVPIAGGAFLQRRRKRA
ncbi:MAG: DNRLRE domain-containing protein [Parvularculaceae bacterium]|nr:DNRLRE domain-containing protein [Parvularculaceae bacterium]